MTFIAAQKQKKHIGPIDPHALKIPARRAESLFGEIHPHLYAEPKHAESNAAIISFRLCLAYFFGIFLK